MVNKANVGGFTSADVTAVTLAAALPVGPTKKVAAIDEAIAQCQAKPPSMPSGSPGMEGPQSNPYDTLLDEVPVRVREVTIH